ncbi:uncharacterized protein LOC123873350 [Maniola jurtina]|uniref:uncharacterized protein LOC123873350 n=1 Tax=Maniola jurtina TaxID=191418 RepID=UPI001E689B06|nr:uncharacterized protein LOC123873350 [Maniola jurtina]
MYFELPKLTRCCFCMPLRRGLLTIGYINLFFSTIGVVVYWTPIQMHVDLPSFAYDDLDALGGEINAVVYFIDLVFSVILVYGAHKQIARWLKAYYYYSLATFVMMIILFLRYIYETPRYTEEDVAMSATRWCIYFYLILLVRSFLEKLENKSGLTYDNQVEEVVIGDGEMKKDKTIYPNVSAETV